MNRVLGIEIVDSESQFLSKIETPEFAVPLVEFDLVEFDKSATEVQDESGLCRDLQPTEAAHASGGPVHQSVSIVPGELRPFFARTKR
ncbi:MAG: hypothetical protein O7D94_10720, partial [Planctomycetota bacterium]|nr:hypothetical protein [Planctomycetota bacterium]